MVSLRSKGVMSFQASMPRCWRLAPRAGLRVACAPPRQVGAGCSQGSGGGPGVHGWVRQSGSADVPATVVSMHDHPGRNMQMVERIVATPARYPFSFVVIGDTGAWPDPTADAIFAQLLRQAAELSPVPVFLANLGDFAGPGTPERHRQYLELVAALSIPNVCLIGNHDLEHARAPEAWTAIHGPRNFQFAYGNTRFVAIDGASGQTGDLGDTTPPDTAGPSVEALRFLDDTLAATSEPHRVVLLHAPPHLDGHYAPQPECGFRQGEPEFHDIIRRHDVKLVCCAHGLGFDHLSATAPAL